MFFVTLSSSGISPITLPDFDKGNEIVEDIRTQFKRSMDGTIYSYRSTPSVIVYKFTFSNMNETLAQELLTFLLAAADQDITITRGSTIYTGRINVPEFIDTITRRRKGHSISIEFTTNI